MCMIVYFFFFKQKTAYEMRISDWSSDVCSSDLELDFRTTGRAQIAASALESFLDRGQFEMAHEVMTQTPGIMEVLSPEKQRELQGRVTAFQQIGRASGRERVCQYV